MAIPSDLKKRLREMDDGQRECVLAQFRAEHLPGGARRSLRQVLDGIPQTGPGRQGRAKGEVVDLTPRQLRRRGVVGQAALLLAAGAELETDPERRDELRQLAQSARAAAAPRQLEFNFFAGNTSVAHEYWDAIDARLRPLTNPGMHRDCHAALGHIVRHLKWQSSESNVTAAQLAELMRMDKAAVSRVLKLLEQIGAIVRTPNPKNRREKAIRINPEAAYYGDLNKHAETVQEFSTVVNFPKQPA